MPFDTGVPPPRSKYHGMSFTLENLDIGHEEPDKCEDVWMVSSGFEGDLSPTASGSASTQQVACPKLQKYTSQQWLEEIENRYFVMT